MATLRQRKSKWQVQIRRQGQSALSRSFALKDDAQRWARQMEAQIDCQGIQPDLRPLRRTSVSELVVRFREEETPKRKGGRNETLVLNAFLRNKLSQLPLSEIQPSHFARYRDERLKRVKPGTVIRELGLIQTVFEIAKTRWGFPLSGNPVRAIKKPRADEGRNRRLKGGEWERITEALGDSRNPVFRPLIEIAVETAMRRGEILSARKGHLDWEASTLNIPMTKTGVPRTIPLTPRALELFRELAADKSDNELLFDTTASAVNQGWKRLTKRAGLIDLHFHDLRHEALSGVRAYETELGF
jgi:integrase